MTPAQKGFVDTITPFAKVSQTITRVPWQFAVAEAIEESGYGVHAPGMNLFGVKSQPGDGWNGAITTQRTREVIAGKDVIITANFRAYPTWQGSFDDHAQFLIRNKRYASAFKTQDPQEFCRAVAAAGYATDPHYADAIIAVMHSAGLI